MRPAATNIGPHRPDAERSGHGRWILGRPYLVAERLAADESFSIFQNQVAGELASIAVTLGQLADEPQVTATE